MASNLRVDQIIASTSDSVSIGTATFTGGLSGNITGLNVTGVITATTLNQNVSGVITATTFSGDVNAGVVTATGGFVVGTGASVYSPATNMLALGTNSAERVRINSTGVGIKTNDPDAPLTIQESGDVQIRLKNSSGTTKAYLGTAGAFGSGSTDDLRIRSDGNILFGSAGSEKMRMLSGGGLTFNGDTAAANALDDYEEGTCTLYLATSSKTSQISSSGGTGITYTKIGRKIHIYGYTVFSNIQSTLSTNHVYLWGFPYNFSSLGNSVDNGIWVWTNGTAPTNYWNGRFPGISQIINTDGGGVFAHGYNAYSSLTGNDFGNSDLHFNFDYTYQI